MNRSARAHRSTKIPNVKLRPAQKESASSLASSSKQHQNKVARQRNQLIDDREDAAHFRRFRDDGHDQGAHLDADFIGSSAHPLKGAIISITGLGESKAALTQYARELGARVEGNLTEDVTHLIADRPGSEKYRFALDLGMHIVHPDWIMRVREAWLQGEDVDAEELEQQRQLPALSNTVICFSALAGAERRKYVALAKELGATVSDELRFDGTITHLVSATADPNESSSVHHLLHFLDRSRHGRAGTREQAASRILAVRPEWLVDCREAGGCLSEQLYSIFASLPDQAQREELIQKASVKIPSPFVRQEEPVTVPFQSPFVGSSRSKLDLAESGSIARNGRNSDVSHAEEDDDDEQPITIGSRQKAAAAAEKSFDNILSQLRSNQPPSSTTGPPTSASVLAPTSATTSTPTAALYKPHRTSLLGMSRASSFSPAPPPSLTLNSTTTQLAMRKASTSNLVTLPHSTPTNTQDSRLSNLHGIFHGKTFKVAFKDSRRNAVLEGVLRDNGAQVLHLDSTTAADYAVVDPTGNAAVLQAFVEAKTVPVLHFWIEYCLHHEFFIQPEAYFAALPALVPLPLAEGEKLRLLLLGFDPESPELYHAHKLVAEIGGRVVKQMKGESISHVICGSQESFEGRRAQRARSNGIPVVGLEFIIKARQMGRLLPPPIPVAMMEQSSSSAMTASTSSVDTISRHNEEEALPLSGCTVSRSRILASQSLMLERKVLQLGATWQAQPNDSTSHLLHTGSGLPRESKDLGRGVFVIHPTWLDKCFEQGIRVDESLFPCSMNPSKSLLTVLSSSDGSATGNFLSQASQTQPAELVAAAKPWERSISADAGVGSVDPMAEARVGGRSEEVEVTQEVGEDEAFDADITLSGDVRDPAPSSQTLIEGEQNSPIPEVRGPSAAVKGLSADAVVELLKSRAAQSSRKKSRLPRSRKRPSDEPREPNLLPPEKVLEAQAKLDAERAQQAAELGYSLGMDKELGVGGESFDASVRIVYNDDPAAMKERNRLQRLLDLQRKEEGVESGVIGVKSEDGDAQMMVEDSRVEDNARKRERERGNEDGFGSGRNRPAWDSRGKSESPSKRPVVRRQPLARR